MTAITDPQGAIKRVVRQILWDAKVSRSELAALLRAEAVRLEVEERTR